MKQHIKEKDANKYGTVNTFTGYFPDIKYANARENRNVEEGDHLRQPRDKVR